MFLPACVAGRPLQTQYSLRSSGTPGSLQSGYFARSASAQNIVGVASGSPRRCALLVMPMPPELLSDQCVMLLHNMSAVAMSGFAQ